MKRKYIIILIIIQRPNQLGNDIDMYLRPLIEDLYLVADPGFLSNWPRCVQAGFEERQIKHYKRTMTQI